MSKIIKRTIQDDVEKSLFKGKLIVIYGARQTGKTTLLKEIQKKYFENSAYYNCDNPEIRNALTNVGDKKIRDFLGNNKLVFLDEAQRIENIGLTLKIAVDTFPEIQIVATGSSSFELSNKIIEPLTGRKYEFFLHPFSIKELLEAKYQKWDIKNIIENQILLTGLYPAVVESEGGKQIEAKKISRDYLFKDILTYQGIKDSEMIEKLLQALALQAGGEVSYSELANLLDMNKETVASYIRILEQAFIIFRLRPLHRNLRTELRKLRKIYFYDSGIRNALINNFNPINLRNDIGALWENFLISERLKYNGNIGISNNIYFWRTHQKQEIDYIEEAGGRLSGFEFKWNRDKFHKPKAFMEAYPGSDIQLINKENFLEFTAGIK